MLSLEEAQSLVDSIAVRQLPEVWSVLGKKRILDRSLDYQSQVLLLLYASAESGVLIEDIREWVDYDRASQFIDRVVAPLHKQGFIEYDEDSRSVLISPSGAARAESVILARRKNCNGDGSR